MGLEKVDVWKNNWELESAKYSLGQKDSKIKLYYGEFREETTCFQWFNHTDFRLEKNFLPIFLLWNRGLPKKEFLIVESRDFHGAFCRIRKWGRVGKGKLGWWKFCMGKKQEKSGMYIRCCVRVAHKKKSFSSKLNFQFIFFRFWIFIFFLVSCFHSLNYSD